MPSMGINKCDGLSWHTFFIRFTDKIKLSIRTILKYFCVKIMNGSTIKILELKLNV